MRRLAWYTILVLATLAGVLLLWQFQEPIILFVLAVATAAAFRPLIDRLDVWLPRGVALVLAYALVLLGVAGALVVIGGPVVHDMDRAANDFTRYYEQLKSRPADALAPVLATITAQLPPPAALYRSLAGQQGAALVESLLGAAANFTGFLSQLVIVLAISLYWNADHERFEPLLFSLVPARSRSRVRRTWHAIETGVGAYIAGELVLALLTGGLLWAGYSLIGLKYPALLATSGAVAGLIPWLGAILAIVPALFIGFDGGLLSAALVGLYTFVVILGLELFVRPRFFARQQYSSLLMMIVALLLVFSSGLLGLVMAPPLAAALQILAAGSREPEDQEAMPAAIAQREKDFETRLAAVRHELEAGTEPPSMELVSLMARLDQLVDESREYL